MKVIRATRDETIQQIKGESRSRIVKVNLAPAVMNGEYGSPDELIESLKKWHGYDRFSVDDRTVWGTGYVIWANAIKGPQSMSKHKQICVLIK
jgi:hypothetical protein